MVYTPPISPSTQASFAHNCSNEVIYSEAPDYKDVGGLINYLRQRNDPALYEPIIADMRQMLHADDGGKDPLPRAVMRHDGTFNLILKARDVESIVLSGGGAKGVSYVALKKEMDEGLFPHVREFIGSSAGSLAGTFMSFGHSPAHTQKMLAEELPKLFKTRENLRNIYPSLHFHDTMQPFARALWKISGGKPPGEANEFVKKLDEVSSQATSAYLSSLEDKELESYVVRYCDKNPGKISQRDEILNRLKMLRLPADFSQNREGAMITFSDIDILHSIDPKRFKDIQVTGFDITSRKVKYFNVAETPNMPLAYAARSSMSHPLLATGVSFSKNLDETGNVYIDGGIASNIPSEAVYNHNLKSAMGEGCTTADEEVRAKTIVMKFDESYTFLRQQAEAASQKKSIFKRILSSIIRYLKDWFIKLVSHNPRAESHFENDRRKFHAAGPNGYVLYHGDLRTTETNVTPERQQRAIDEASIGILAQALQRREQGFFVTVNTIEEAYDRLSEKEKEQILNAPPPSRESFGFDQAEQRCKELKRECEMLQDYQEATDEKRNEAMQQLEKAQTALKRLENEFRSTSTLYELVRKRAPSLIKEPIFSLSLQANSPIISEEKPLVPGQKFSPIVTSSPEDEGTEISTIFTINSESDLSDDEA